MLALESYILSFRFKIDFSSSPLQVTNQEAVDIVRPLCMGVNQPELSSACKELSQLSSRRGSIDDITVMIIQLGSFSS